MRIFLLISGLFLAGCMAAPVKAPVVNAQGMALGARGLHPVGSPLEISFGRFRDGVLSSVQKLTGERPEAVVDCGRPGVSVAVYASGLTLGFTDRHLSGWKVTQPGYRSRSGNEVGQVLIGAPGDGVRYETRAGTGATGGQGRITMMSAGARWADGQACPLS